MGGKTGGVGRVASTGETGVVIGAAPGAPVAFWFCVCTGGGEGGAPQTLNEAVPNRAAMHAARGFMECFMCALCEVGLFLLRLCRLYGISMLRSVFVGF
jgi:hypothetical protein